MFTSSYSYPTFHELAENYLRSRDLKLTELHRMMKNKYYWDKLAYSTVVHYHKGERPPNPKYVLLLKHCLRLPNKQFRLLIRALHIDFIHNLFRDFKRHEALLISEGAIKYDDRILWNELEVDDENR